MDRCEGPAIVAHSSLQRREKHDQGRMKEKRGFPGQNFTTQ
jgi:hypothetical protein